MNSGKPTANQMALQGAIFNLKSQIIFTLQDIACQTEELISFRKNLVSEMVTKVRELTVWAGIRQVIESINTNAAA